MSICEQWCKRTRMTLEYDEYVKVIQADVNNYIIVDENGKYKSKGRIAKKQRDLDYDLPILNECVINHFVHGKSVQETVMNCNDLIKFQKIFKIGSNYDYCVHNGKILNEKVNRVFASICNTDTSLFKKHQDKTTLDKLPDVPEHCFIINENVTDKPIPSKLDREWYVAYADKKIKQFLGK